MRPTQGGGHLQPQAPLTAPGGWAYRAWGHTGEGRPLFSHTVPWGHTATPTREDGGPSAAQRATTGLGTAPAMPLPSATLGSCCSRRREGGPQQDPNNVEWGNKCGHMAPALIQPAEEARGTTNTAQGPDTPADGPGRPEHSQGVTQHRPRLSPHPGTAPAAPDAPPGKRAHLQSLSQPQQDGAQQRAPGAMRP